MNNKIKNKIIKNSEIVTIFYSKWCAYSIQALELLETTKAILIGDPGDKENLIKFFRLVPVPEINTATLIFLSPIDFCI